MLSSQAVEERRLDLERLANARRHYRLTGNAQGGLIQRAPRVAVEFHASRQGGTPKTAIARRAARNE